MEFLKKEIQSMTGGIISQYGFLYQRYVFIDIAISHAAMDLFYTYEGADDIEAAKDNVEEVLIKAFSSKKNYIQVKSGNVS